MCACQKTRETKEPAHSVTHLQQQESNSRIRQLIKQHQQQEEEDEKEAMSSMVDFSFLLIQFLLVLLLVLSLDLLLLFFFYHYYYYYFLVVFWYNYLSFSSFSSFFRGVHSTAYFRQPFLSFSQGHHFVFFFPSNWLAPR